MIAGGTWICLVGVGLRVAEHCNAYSQPLRFEIQSWNLTLSGIKPRLDSPISNTANQRKKGQKFFGGKTHSGKISVKLLQCSDFIESGEAEAGIWHVIGELFISSADIMATLVNY